MKTVVVIRGGERDYRFITTVTVGKVFRQVVRIVRNVNLLCDARDMTFRIAEAAFVTFPQYPVRTDKLFESDVADWTVIVDCDKHRIYVGRCEDDKRDGSIVFGESCEKIKWEKLR